VYFEAYLEQYLFLYPIFWILLGSLFWALFVVGHDCGHRSFSPSILVCDFFGHLAHTPLLVPFHPWRLSHAKHHKHTGDIEKDESYVAVTETYYKEMYFTGKIFRFYSYPVFGFSLYLLMGMPTTYHSHFLPIGDFYITTKNKLESIFSSVSVIIFLALIWNLGSVYGLWWITKMYLIPYLVFGAWIATVTHLHHTHPDVPWYRGEGWSFVKGAVSSIDREYWPFENLHHDIGTHIVHHLFSRIPHYNLVEATQHIQPILGKHYRRSLVSPFSAMTTIYSYCRFISDHTTKNTRLFFNQEWDNTIKNTKQ